MDEMAALAGVDPLEFRLAHLDDPRLRPVLEEAAERFNWARAREEQAAEPRRRPGVQHRQGSFVACCVEVEVDPAPKRNPRASTCARRSIAGRC